MMKHLSILPVVLLVVTQAMHSCKTGKSGPSKELVNEIGLKKGEIILCGPPGEQLGTATFDISCGNEVKDDFNLAIKLLHSFEYDEAEKVFARVIDKEPGCAMAYWGVAMANFHPLWTPPTEAELKKGAKAVEIARSLPSSGREKAFIEAIASFYHNWQSVDHRTRSLAFERSMEKVYTSYDGDNEAAVFYALSLTAAADPTDKTFVKQKKAGSILEGLHPGAPSHPGIIHYLIHTYDSPEMAEKGLAAAKKYASIAPSSAHALHMPSHIFTRLGLWDECINSNIASVESAKCYAESAGMKGHWDEELHGLDYLVYAYLQKGDTVSAKKQWDYLESISQVEPVNFKVAYAYAAIPSRYLLENRLWKEASRLEGNSKVITWKKFPWQNAIIHFTRLMGSVHTGDLDAARAELNLLGRLHEDLVQQKDSYKANQVAIQIKMGEAWIKMKEKKTSEALALMQLAADMEDKTEKHPVTPGEVLPARELLGDMLLQLQQPEKALLEYEASLKKHPNRFNAVYGAALSAKMAGKAEKATSYFQQLENITGRLLPQGKAAIL